MAKRKRGRPATGHDPLVGVRMPPRLRKKIEAWAAEQGDGLALSEAVRQLVQRALRRDEAVKAQRLRRENPEIVAKDRDSNRLRMQRVRCAQADSENLLSFEQAAKRLRVSKFELRDILVANEDIKVVQLSARRHRIDAQSLASVGVLPRKRFRSANTYIQSDDYERYRLYLHGNSVS